MNKVFLIGNLTRDPELSTTPSGVSVVHFDIAVNRPYTDGNVERQTDFFNCSAWRGLAENIGRYCVKGSKVAVSGSIQIRNYEDNQGNRHTAVDIIVQDCEFLMQRKRDENEESAPQRQAPAKKRPVQQSFDSFDDDGDIPF